MYKLKIVDRKIKSTSVRIVQFRWYTLNIITQHVDA